MINSVYIHIPFCRQICHYCDYNKIFFKDDLVDEYLSALEKEMTLTIKSEAKPTVETIFIGGGTPTSLSESQVERLMTIIRQNFIFAKDLEFTIEANPDEISPEKFDTLRAGQVNRISFGVQSFNDGILQALGRTHRVKDVFASFDKALAAGFDNFTIDLMFGLPNQTIRDLELSLQEALKLPIKHISTYSLSVEERTVFHNQLQKGKLTLPTEDEDAEMYELIIAKLAEKNFQHYEISNFAKAGFESKHNLTYWNNEEYYGFGAGAASYIKGVRASNLHPVTHYIKSLQNEQLPIREAETLTVKDQITEELFLGLRKIAGVSLETFKNKYSVSLEDYYGQELESLLAKNLVQIKAGHLQLTKKGLLFGDDVFRTFI